MATTVFDVLKKKISEDISSAQEFLSHGGAKDYPQYKEITGLIRGLETCNDYVLDLAKNYMEDDDD